MNVAQNRPTLGMLQLQNTPIRLPRAISNPDTYDFPVRYLQVPCAWTKNLVGTDMAVVEAYIAPTPRRGARSVIAGTRRFPLCHGWVFGTFRVDVSVAIGGGYETEKRQIVVLYTIKLLICGCSSVVERQLPKLYVVGSIPITRSNRFSAPTGAG